MEWGTGIQGKEVTLTRCITEGNILRIEKTQTERKIRDRWKGEQEKMSKKKQRKWANETLIHRTKHDQLKA